MCDAFKKSSQTFVGPNWLIKFRGDMNSGAFGTEIHVEQRLNVFGTPRYDVKLHMLAESTKPFICLFCT